MTEQDIIETIDTTFAHLADLHLAKSPNEIRKIDPDTGRRVRDLDMTEAFETAVTDILEQDPRPAVCIIAGDIFDSYTATQDAIIDAAKQIKRLRNAGIEVIGIAGNHDTPTQRKRTPAFLVLKHEFEEIAEDKGVHLAYDEVMHIQIGDVEYVLLPHAVVSYSGFTPDDIEPTTNAKYKVLVVHGVAEGDKAFRQQGEIKEVPIAKWLMDKDWDYIAFGHFHVPGWIKGYEGKAAYCGSLENTVITGPDVCGARGPVYVDLTKNGEDRMDMHTIPIRKIITLPTIEIEDGESLTSLELDKMVEKQILDMDNELDGAIVHQNVTNVPIPVYKDMPRRQWLSANPNILYIRTNIIKAQDSDYIAQLSDDENVEPEYDEDGNLIERIQSGSRSFKPLATELNDQLEILIENGTIKESNKNAIIDILADLM